MIFTVDEADERQNFLTKFLAWLHRWKNMQGTQIKTGFF